MVLSSAGAVSATAAITWKKSKRNHQVILCPLPLSSFSLFFLLQHASLYRTQLRHIRPQTILTSGNQHLSVLGALFVARCSNLWTMQGISGPVVCSTTHVAMGGCKVCVCVCFEGGGGSEFFARNGVRYRRYSRTSLTKDCLWTFSNIGPNSST